MKTLSAARAGLVAAIIAVAAVSIPCFADDDEATLRHLKEVLWPRAYAEQDVELLDSILADEFQMVDAEGEWSTKADELAYVRGNRPTYDSFVFRIKRLEVFENGTAVVAGEGTIRGAGKDGPYAMTYQSSNILIKRNGAWMAIASHVSGIKPLEPSDGAR